MITVIHNPQKSSKPKNNYFRSEKTMRINKTLTVLIAGASIGMSGQVFSAASSKAGEDITNTASLTYTVGNSSVSNTATSDSVFKVDKKIDFTTSINKSDSKVYAGLSEATEDRLFTFTLINEGNADQYFNIADAVSKYVIGATSLDGSLQDFLLGNVVIHLDDDADFSNGVTSTGITEVELKSENLTDTFVADSDRVFVHIEADLVPSLVLGNYRDKDADSELTYTDDLTGAMSYTEIEIYPISGSGGTQITSDDSETAFNASTMQTVFADNNTDGFGVELLDAQFALQSAYVSLNKSAAVTASNIPGYDDTNDVMHFLPGSTVEYTLEATNEGDLDAETVVITDDLTDSEIAGNAVFDYSSIILPTFPTADGIIAGTGHDPANGIIVLDFGTLDLSGSAADTKSISFSINVQ